MTLLFKNLNIIGKEDGLYNIAIKDGVIDAISSSSDLCAGNYDDVIDCSGYSASAGFIDMHCHLVS